MAGAGRDRARKFTGERDGATGFDYLGARDLSPGLGRFMRADDPGFGSPFDPQSMNLYAHAYNNPLKYVDPTGHSGDCVGEVDAAGFCERVVDLFAFWQESVNWFNERIAIWEAAVRDAAQQQLQQLRPNTIEIVDRAAI